MKSANIKIRDLVGAIVSNLDCSQKALCSLIGVTETALSTSLDKDVKGQTSKVPKRLMSLLYVVETLKKDKTLDGAHILKVLKTPCYLLEDGTFLDVVSGIHEGTNRNEFLMEVADAALKQLRSKYELDKKPAEDSIYSRAHLA